MKVTLQKDYRKFYTLEDLERAKAVIAFEKDNDESSVKEWAEYAINEAIGNEGRIIEIYKADATTAKNCRAWNLYGNDTQDMDVWVQAVAETTAGFVKIGAYLSDIWQTGAKQYRQHMFIRMAKYTD